MGRERFFIGMAILMAPFIGFSLLSSPRAAEVQSGSLDGHISIHGSPMKGGFIVLFPEDNKSAGAAGRIDDRGNFHIGPRWIWKSPSETRFRICLLPGKRTSGSAEGATTFPPELRRLARPQTTNLEVQLDEQSANIDIHL